MEVELVCCLCDFKAANSEEELEAHIDEVHKDIYLGFMSDKIQSGEPVDLKLNLDQNNSGPFISNPLDLATVNVPLGLDLKTEELEGHEVFVSQALQQQPIPPQPLSTDAEQLGVERIKQSYTELLRYKKFDCNFCPFFSTNIQILAEHYAKKHQGANQIRSKPAATAEAQVQVKVEPSPVAIQPPSVAVQNSRKRPSLQGEELNVPMARCSLPPSSATSGSGVIIPVPAGQPAKKGRASWPEMAKTLPPIKQEAVQAPGTDTTAKFVTKNKSKDFQLDQILKKRTLLNKPSPKTTVVKTATMKKYNVSANGFSLGQLNYSGTVNQAASKSFDGPSKLVSQQTKAVTGSSAAIGIKPTLLQAKMNTGLPSKVSGNPGRKSLVPKPAPAIKNDSPLVNNVNHGEATKVNVPRKEVTSTLIPTKTISNVLNKNRKWTPQSGMPGQETKKTGVTQSGIPIAKGPGIEPSTPEPTVEKLTAEVKMLKLRIVELVSQKSKESSELRERNTKLENQVNELLAIKQEFDKVDAEIRTTRLNLSQTEDIQDELEKSLTENEHLVKEIEELRGQKLKLEDKILTFAVSQQKYVQRIAGLKEKLSSSKHARAMKISSDALKALEEKVESLSAELSIEKSKTFDMTKKMGTLQYFHTKAEDNYRKTLSQLNLIKVNGEQDQKMVATLRNELVKSQELGSLYLAIKWTLRYVFKQDEKVCGAKSPEDKFEELPDQELCEVAKSMLQDYMANKEEIRASAKRIQDLLVAQERHQRTIQDLTRQINPATKADEMATTTGAAAAGKATPSTPAPEAIGSLGEGLSFGSIKITPVTMRKLQLPKARKPGKKLTPPKIRA